ncbi:MAG: metal ABC transporter permease [Actinomycetes bacterium]
MDLGSYLALPFAQHALIAGTLIAVTCGVLSPFVLIRQMAFAVHGAAELSFTGAAAGLVLLGDPVIGALCGSVVVAGLIGSLGDRPRERDSSIGVVLAGGLGLGVLLLSQYQGFASAATSILFGDIFAISSGQIWLLVVLAVLVLAGLSLLYRPLLFASVDPELASASGVPTRLLGIAFLLLLAVTVTEAAQVVGTLLVLSLAIIPGATAQRLATAPLAATAVSVGVALVATDGGLLLALNGTTVPPTVFVTGISVSAYVLARLVGPRLAARRARALEVARRLS